MIGDVRGAGPNQTLPMVGNRLTVRWSSWLEMKRGMNTRESESPSDEEEEEEDEVVSLGMASRTVKPTRFNAGALNKTIVLVCRLVKSLAESWVKRLARCGRERSTSALCFRIGACVNAC